MCAHAAPPTPGLHGRVVTRDSKPIAGAHVTFFPRVPLPDVRVPGVSFHTTFDLLFRPLTDEAFDEVLRLATLESAWPKPLLTVTTRADGSYDAPGVPFLVDALIVAPDGARATFTWSLEDQWPELLVVPRDAPREVVVNEYPSGKSISDAEVIVIPHSPRTGPPLRSRTNASGVAVLSGLPDEQHALVLLRAKGFMSVADVSLSSIAPKKRTELVMLASEPLSGRVLKNGKPVAGAQVEVVTSYSFPATTDAKGEFTIPKPACVGCELLARSGNDVGLFFVGAPTRTPSTLELVETGAVRVRAFDSATKAPLALPKFDWVDAKDQVQINPFSSDDAGVWWTASSVPVGQHRLVVAAENYLPQDFEFRAVAGKRLEFSVPMLREYEFTGTLDGGLPQRQGQMQLLTKWPDLPVKGAIVAPELPGPSLCESVAMEFNVNSDGTFRGDGIAGEYLLRFEEDCRDDFLLRIPESWPEYCNWLGTEFGVEEPRRRGDAYIDTHCPLMETRVKLPLKAPLSLVWKPMHAKVFVEVVVPDPSDGVFVSLERGGKTETWAHAEKPQFLVLPGTYVVRASNEKTKAAKTVTVMAGTTVKLVLPVH
ncbi:MAG: hypothetical protein QM817_37080 [Archangium sp.]